MSADQARILSTQYSVLGTEYGVWKPESILPALGPGQVAVLSGNPGLGMTRLGLVMLSGYTGGTVAYLDVRGIARCGEVVRWGRVAAALLDGATAVLAEVPIGAKDASIRKLAALARNRGTPLLLRPIDRTVPAGVAHLMLEARETAWRGAVDGHGRIDQRMLRITASGKAMKGMARTIEMEDDGSNALRVVSGVAATDARSATG
jgi:hypothetical protein